MSNVAEYVRRQGSCVQFLCRLYAPCFCSCFILVRHWDVVSLSSTLCPPAPQESKVGSQARQGFVGMGGYMQPNNEFTDGSFFLSSNCQACSHALASAWHTVKLSNVKGSIRLLRLETHTTLSGELQFGLFLSSCATGEASHRIWKSVQAIWLAAHPLTNGEIPLKH